MSDSFQELIAGGQPATRLVKNGEPEDDPMFPKVYQAVRHIRTYAPSDAAFRHHAGGVQGFPWMRLNSWLGDGTGSRLTLVWPEMEVTLTGRNLHTVEDAIQRRIIGEFRQVEPDKADTIMAGLPVIELIQFEPIGRQESE
jgi:hypothetical protein